MKEQNSSEYLFTLHKTEDQQYSLIFKVKSGLEDFLDHIKHQHWHLLERHSVHISCSWLKKKKMYRNKMIRNNLKNTLGSKQETCLSRKCEHEQSRVFSFFENVILTNKRLEINVTIDLWLWIINSYIHIMFGLQNVLSIFLKKEK